MCEPFSSADLSRHVGLIGEFGFIELESMTSDIAEKQLQDGAKVVVEDTYEYDGPTPTLLQFLRQRSDVCIVPLHWHEVQGTAVGRWVGGPVICMSAMSVYHPSFFCIQATMAAHTDP